jgi:hypothetical protein
MPLERTLRMNKPLVKQPLIDPFTLGGQPDLVRDRPERWYVRLRRLDEIVAAAPLARLLG